MSITHDKEIVRRLWNQATNKGKGRCAYILSFIDYDTAIRQLHLFFFKQNDSLMHGISHLSQFGSRHLCPELFEHRPDFRTLNTG
ncbi:Uncharacterised protein [Klebsiella pneumoniae]|nr:Uncharacterised protein [Klebsiella pneumoniae]